jgi:hypothetical protein
MNDAFAVKVLTELRELERRYLEGLTAAKDIPGAPPAPAAESEIRKRIAALSCAIRKLVEP